MQPSHAQMYRRLLESVSHYSKKSLGLLESGAGDLPQWTNDVLSATRTHLKDVTHFLRGQADHGIRYGGDPHGRAYMATKNLREVSEYADEALSHMKESAGHFPAWVENKISICAEYMDLIGHWLENESVEGRKYGTYLNPVPGDAGDEALYRGRADGIGGVKRNPYSPNSFQHKIYEQGFREGYGGSPRGYGDDIGDQSVEVGARRYGRGPGGRGRGGGRHPGGGPGMGRGRGRRRRHRRNGVHGYPYWNLPYNVYYPVYEEAFPIVESVTPHWDDSEAVIILQGSGFNLIPGSLLFVELKQGGLAHRIERREIHNRSDQSMEIRIRPLGGIPEDLEILGIAYSTNDGQLVLLTGPFSMAKGRKRFARTPSAPKPSPGTSSQPRMPSVPSTSQPPSGRPPSSRPPTDSNIPGAIPIPTIPEVIHPGDVPGLLYQPGFGSAMAPGPAPTSLEPSKMEYMMPPNRMLEPHRQGLLHRQLGHQTGRRFGVPGFVAGQPGWAGQAGVAQIPHPTRGRGPTVDRTFGPGLSAGQGGVQTFPGDGGPMAVQTYGSLGYASMGDGSMDMAVRGARRFARTNSPARRSRAKKRRRNILK